MAKTVKTRQRRTKKLPAVRQAKQGITKGMGNSTIFRRPSRKKDV